MKNTFSDRLKAGYSKMDIGELLKQDVTAIVGIDKAAAIALKKIGITTIFDFGASWVFANARAIVEISTNGSLAHRLGVVPSNLLKSSYKVSNISEIAEAKIVEIKGIDRPEDKELMEALNIETIRELAFLPQYCTAKEILRAASGGTFGLETPTIEEGEELRPRLGQYPTERVYYNTLMMMQMEEDAEATDFTDVLSLKHVSTDKKGHKKIAIGAYLTMAQSWYAQGVTLGHMLHSLALAPGEATRIAVYDWSKKIQGMTTETGSESEQLDNSMTHSRSVSEVQSAVANEMQQGGSSNTTNSFGISAGLAAEIGTGLLTSLTVSGSTGASLQTAFSTSNSQSASWSVGNRSAQSNMAQDVNDRTEQHATSTRNRRASSVTEISQSEHESVSTRIVANYNHMHALTVQYYEVVQVYRITTEVQSAERCLFIPLEVVTFDGNDAMEYVERFRGVLATFALSQEIRDLLLKKHTYLTFVPRTQILRMPTKELIDSVSIPDRLILTPESSIKPNPNPVLSQEYKKLGIISPKEIVDFQKLTGFSLHREGSGDMNISIYATVQSITFDNVGASNVQIGNKSYPIKGNKETLVFEKPIPFSDIKEIKVQKNKDQSVIGTMTLGINTPNGIVPMPPFDINLPQGRSSFTVVELKPVLSEDDKYLLNHLRTNYLYYNQIIARSLDTSTIVMLLSKYKYQGKTLVNQVEPKPIGYAGNFLIFKAPIGNNDTSGIEENGKNLSWSEALAKRGVDLTKSKDERIVSLPTAGVFAEAVLGRSNSAEKLDITRFWNWQDSPIPLTPTEIAPVQMGSRSEQIDTKPSGFGTPTLNIVNPTSLPDPAGLGAILSVINNGGLFRDMSGLQQTIAATMAGQKETMSGTTAAGQLATENLRIGAQRAVEMAKLQTDLIKSAITTYMGMPLTESNYGATNISSDGAKINHGRNMDERGIIENDSSSTPSSGGVVAANPSGTGGTGNLTGIGASEATSNNFSRELAYADKKAIGYSPDAVASIVPKPIIESTPEKVVPKTSPSSDSKLVRINIESPEGDPYYATDFLLLMYGANQEGDILYIETSDGYLFSGWSNTKFRDFFIEVTFYDKSKKMKFSRVEKLRNNSKKTLDIFIKMKYQNGSVTETLTVRDSAELQAKIESSFGETVEAGGSIKVVETKVIGTANVTTGLSGSRTTEKGTIYEVSYQLLSPGLIIEIK